MSLIKSFKTKLTEPKNGSSDISYDVNIILYKTAFDKSTYGEWDQCRDRLFKRLEDFLFDTLKKEIVADDLLTEKVLNEIRLLVAKRLVDREEK
jgi:hypothetical protein